MHAQTYKVIPKIRGSFLGVPIIRIIVFGVHIRVPARGQQHSGLFDDLGSDLVRLSAVLSLFPQSGSWDLRLPTVMAMAVAIVTVVETGIAMEAWYLAIRCLLQCNGLFVAFIATPGIEYSC